MKLDVNGSWVSITAPPETPLIFVLRDELGLKSPKLGCAAEQCGACRVLIDGVPRYSCTMALEAVDGKAVTTVEGLVDHPVQAVLTRHNAAQCGICIAGIVIAAVALFERTPKPTRDEIRVALAPQLCRCGAQPRILRALGELADG